MCEQVKGGAGLTAARARSKTLWDSVAVALPRLVFDPALHAIAEAGAAAIAGMYRPSGRSPGNAEEASVAATDDQPAVLLAMFPI